MRYLVAFRTASYKGFATHDKGLTMKGQQATRLLGYWIEKVLSPLSLAIIHGTDRRMIETSGILGGGEVHSRKINPFLSTGVPGPFPLTSALNDVREVGENHDVVVLVASHDIIEAIPTYLNGVECVYPDKPGNHIGEGMAWCFDFELKIGIIIDSASLPKKKELESLFEEAMFCSL